MYNGIGLQTPRGSGTNGYIQANKFHVRARPPKVEPKVFQAGEGRGGVSKKANQEILEHDRKRKIALAIVMLEETLIEQGFTDAEIQERVAAERKKLEEAADKEHNEKVRKTESHQIAALKEKEIERFKNALGAKDRKEGEAFDRDVQALEKEERKQQFLVRQDEKDKRKKELDAEKREKEKEERRKRKDKDREEPSRRGKREEVPRKERSRDEEKERSKDQEQERSRDRRYRDEDYRANRRRDYEDKRSEELRVERRRDEEEGVRNKRKREEERKRHLEGGRDRKEEGGQEVPTSKEERDEDGGRKKLRMADEERAEEPESEPERDRWVPLSEDSESSEDDRRGRRAGR